MSAGSFFIIASAAGGGAPKNYSECDRLRNLVAEKFFDVQQIILWLCS
jgi:hypothetical protein